jgi:uncharacterized membrane protein
VRPLRYSILYITGLGILLCAYLMFRITAPYFTFEPDVDFLLTKQSVLHVDTWRISFYTHISTSLVVMLAGVIQFSGSVLKRFPGLHRAAGKLYIILILFVSAPSGLVMSFYANGGFWPRCSFVIVSILWWIFTWLAYRAIRRHDISQHIAWMVRSYALTLTAISLRLYVLVLPSFILLHPREMYTLVAWLSWVPNLVLAEWVVRKKIFGSTLVSQQAAE